MSRVMNVVGSLLETREELLGEISSLTFEELNFTPDHESWSIAQVCHHLYLTERSFSKGLMYGLQKNNGQKAAPIALGFLTDRSKKYNAPEIVFPTEDPMTLDEIVNSLKDSRKQLSEVINSIENKSILFKNSAKHPLFGEVPLIQWIELIYLHEQRHIEQLKEIKASH